MRNITPFLLLSISAVALTACGKKEAEKPVVEETTSKEIVETVTESVEETVAIKTDEELMSKRYSLVNSGGYEIGKILVRDTDNGIILSIDATSLPEGERAIHFHETGSCDGPDFMSSGGHYNPTGMNHGKLAENGPHAGDMPNVTVPASGVLKTSVRNPMISLSNRESFAPLRDMNGSALIIHAGADDYQTQPTGAAGGRIACAVID